mmetsp:Transcript_57676/g.117456  ORF Transcript_57676/g.117456 Transcript_57676/m.117456 type:complete len:223 (+) Transcript_57676:486-1154(+)
MSKNAKAKGRQHQGRETLERQLQKGHRKAIAPGTTQQKHQRGYHGHCPRPLQTLQTLQCHGDQRIQEPAQKEPRQWPQRRIPTIRRAVELFLRAAEGMPWHLPGMQPSIAQDVGAPRGHRGCGHGQQVPAQPAAVGTNEAMVEVPLPRTHFRSGGQEATDDQQLPDGPLLPLELQTSEPEMVRDDHHHQHKPHSLHRHLYSGSARCLLCLRPKEDDGRRAEC